MTRLWNVARIQMVNAPVVFGIPLLVLALALLSNMAIFAALGVPASEGDHATGGLMSVYIVLLVTHLQTMTQVFPFAAGLSVTRRTFFSATTLVITGQALGYGLLLYLLLLLERATGGWGLQLQFFGLPFLTQDNPALQIIEYTVPFLLTAFIGVWVGVVFKRWGQLGMYVFAISTGLLAVGFVVLVTWQGWWQAVGRFFAEQPPPALFVGYPLAVAAMLAAAGYVTLRRATP